MPRPRNPILAFHQVNIFPIDFYVSDTQTLFNRIKEIRQFNDQENQLLPLPPDAPREIPRMIFKSDDVRIEISFDKFSITWPNPTEGSADFDIKVQEIASLTRSLVSTISSSLLVKRIGLVKQILFKTEDPINSAKFRIISSEIQAENLKSFDVRLTFKSDLEIADNCNELLVFNDGSLNVGDLSKIIIITSDFNTPVDSEISWNVDQLAEFIGQSYVKQKNTELISRFFENHAQ